MQAPNKIVKAALKRIGVDPERYGSHSARRGGATAAAAQGIAMHLLKRHGRWKSDAVYAYISDSLISRLSVALAIFK